MQSPCKKCENVDRPKTECAPSCELLRDWQKGKTALSAYGGQQSNFAESYQYGSGGCNRTQTGIGNT